MSERDDELLTLLRAELSHRAAATPPAGFEARLRTAVIEGRTASAERRTRGVRWLGAPAAALATAVVIAAAVGVGMWRHNAATPAPANPRPTPHAAASGPLLVFDRPSSAGTVEITMVRPDGHVVRSVKAAGGLSFSQRRSRAELIATKAADWVLHRDGSLTLVNPAAKKVFDEAAAFAIFVDDRHALTLLSDNSADTNRLVEVDTVSGLTTVLLEAHIPAGDRAMGDPGIELLAVSPDWRTARLRLHDVVIDGTRQPGAVLADLDLATHRVVRSRPLPVDDAEIAVSPDGRMVAWQEVAFDDKHPVQWMTTHVQDLDSGRAVQAQGVTITVRSGSGGLRFSTDGTRLAVAGPDNLGTPGGIESIALVSTSDGRLLQHIQADAMFTATVDPADWVDDGHFAYSSDTTGTPGVFDDPSLPVGHVVDVARGSAAVRIPDLGWLVAVMF